MIVVPRAVLTSTDERPGLRTGQRIVSGGVVVGEWSLTSAAYTDLHHHDEINHVVEGVLHVTCDGTTTVVEAGGTVVVPAGHLATYAAPASARMFFVYGPSDDGHAALHTNYADLGASAPSANRGGP